MSAQLLVLAFPELQEADLQRIEVFRKVYDINYPIVRPHFTLVFPVSGMDQTDFVNEVKQQLQNISPISFVLRCTVINKDAFADRYHIFLTPDEGNSDLIKLHDKLYSGILYPYYLPEIDFIPHIGIGNTEIAHAAKQLSDQWNANPFEIRGMIRTITIVEYDLNSVVPVSEITL